MPIAAEIPKESATLHKEMLLDHSVMRLIDFTVMIPTTTPSSPPARLSITASIRNCSSTSLVRAPTARRMPISRVRSPTASSMMFMIPTPPTTSETPATAASSAVIVRLARSSVLLSSSSVTLSRESIATERTERDSLALLNSRVERQTSPCELLKAQCIDRVEP